MVLNHIFPLLRTEVDMKVDMTMYMTIDMVVVMVDMTLDIGLDSHLGWVGWATVQGKQSSRSYHFAWVEC